MKKMFGQHRLLFAVCILFIIALMVTACDGNEPAVTAVAEVTEEPTNTPIPATNTPAPTDTAAPTDTPTPTETPVPSNTPTPTDTATPTDTPTPIPTDTPEPTETAAPTNTPAATATPRPATAVPPTPTPAPTATAEGGDADEDEDNTIVVYYISNPNDILGVFPEEPFDAEGLKRNMQNIQGSLNTMRNNLDGAKAADAAACANYVQAYNNILYSGVFYEEVPAAWRDIDVIYFLSFIYSLDRTRPAYLSCIGSGKVDDFNYGLAHSAIEQTLSILTPAIQRALGQ